MRLLTLSLFLLWSLLSPASALAQPSSAGSQPGFSVNARTVYYQIQGRTAADLRAQMNSLGPADSSTGQRYDAFANWTFSWRYNFFTAAGKCRFSSVKLVVGLKYTYPRWVQLSSAPAPLARSWNRYLTVLRTHENGHGAIAVQVGRKILADIRALGPRGSCQKLQATADQIGANGIQRANRAEASYDARTSHGGSQGARFP